MVSLVLGRTDPPTGKRTSGQTPIRAELIHFAIRLPTVHVRKRKGLDGFEDKAEDVRMSRASKRRSC
jgi:hypothetical protein